MDNAYEQSPAPPSLFPYPRVLPLPQISHDGEGSVTAVAAAVVLTDIPPGPTDGSLTAASFQQFSVEFRLDPTSDAFSEMTRSQDRGNLVGRDRSGNPGYLPGLPVLSGRLESSGTSLFVRVSAGLKNFLSLVTRQAPQALLLSVPGGGS